MALVEADDNSFESSYNQEAKKKNDNEAIHIQTYESSTSCFTDIRDPTNYVACPSNRPEQSRHTIEARPVFLKRRALAIFVAIFLLLIIVSSVMFEVSRTHQGLSNVSNDYHYFWTYGPTSVFLILDAVWYQVDYNARVIMPWFAMSKFESAGKSMLLDYISPISFISLYDALKYRHFLLAITMTVTSLLKLLSVFTTGFLALQLNVPIVQPVTLSVTSIFDSAGFQQLPSQESAYVNQKISVQTNQSAYSSLYASTRNQIPLPYWTDGNIISQ